MPITAEKVWRALAGETEASPFACVAGARRF
jgi:hypothetical protein